jgi:hypothetical protein
MAKDQTKSAHCVRDLRDAPLEEFRLPDDKRQWKPLARNRQALANFLATYADGDGSRIFPSVATMTEHFGWSRATAFRLLADLRALGLLSEKTGLHGERGTAVRKMDVTRFRGRTFTGAAALAQNAFAGVSKSSEQESQSPDAGVSKSVAGVSKSTAGVSPVRETQPPRFTVTETVTSHQFKTEHGDGGWFSLQQKHMAAIGYFGRKRQDFQRYIDEFGFDLVDKATLAAIAEGNLENAKSKPGCIVFRLGEKLAVEVKKRDRAKQKAKEDASIEESIELQTCAIVIARDLCPPAYETFDRAERKLMEGFRESHKAFEYYETLTAAEQRLAYHLAETWKDHHPSYRSGSTAEEFMADDIFGEEDNASRTAAADAAGLKWDPKVGITWGK